MEDSASFTVINMSTIKLDLDAFQYINGVVDELMELDDLSRELAEKKVFNFFASQTDEFPADSMLYHETCEYWAKTIYYGRRDWWRECD